MKSTFEFYCSLAIGIVLFILISGCKSFPPLSTEKEIDLERYMGTWHEIARYPNRFQEGCSCSTAEYSISEEGHVDIINRCKKNNKEKEALGKGFVVENSGNAKLKVQFQWPFKGDYWIIHCDTSYKHAVVSAPSRKYLWILNRRNLMDSSTYNAILRMLEMKGFDTKKLIKNEKNCN